MQISEFWKNYEQIYVHPQYPPIYGLYEVESFSLGGQQIAPVATASRWRRVAIDTASSLVVQLMDDSERFYETDYEPAKSTLTIKPQESDDPCVLSYTHPDAAHVLLQGMLEGQTASILLRRLDVSQFPLAKSRFHWISGN